MNFESVSFGQWESYYYTIGRFLLLEISDDSIYPRVNVL